MKYAFILGRLPALSIAEILAVMEKLKIKYSTEIISQKMLVLDIQEKIDCQEILRTMGGTIKIILVSNIKYQVLNIKKSKLKESQTEERDILSALRDKIKTETKQSNKKLLIGYNIYSADKIEQKELNQFSKLIKKNIIALKKELKKEEINCRIVMPKNYETELSSASIVNNKILEKGIDLNFIITSPCPLPEINSGQALDKEGNIGIMLGKTVAIQDIESYSRRDYERPQREAKIGMMPPKLAQIMLNLAQVEKDQLIMDPFCGTGVILQEALLMGCRVIGSDANEKQVQNTKNNLKWLEENYLSPKMFYQVSKIDAMHLAKKIKSSSLDAIVTETTLGPIYTQAPAPKEIRNNFKKLEKIYLKFLAQAKKILKPDAQLVITIPCYQIKKSKFILMPIVDILKKTGYSIKEPLPEDILGKISPTPEITSRNTLIYSRPNQIVGREILVLKL